MSVADREQALALYRRALGLAEKYAAGEMTVLTDPDGRRADKDRPPEP